MKEKGDNLTSERLSKLSVPAMITAILNKSGVVSLPRAIRIVQDALVVKCEPTDLDAEHIYTLLAERSCWVIPESQSFIASSQVVYQSSKRKQELRDSIILSLIRDREIDVQKLMRDANCDFRLLGPIIDTVAREQTGTPRYRIKTYDSDFD